MVVVARVEVTTDPLNALESAFEMFRLADATAEFTDVAKADVATESATAFESAFEVLMEFDVTAELAEDIWVDEATAGSFCPNAIGFVAAMGATESLVIPLVNALASGAGERVEK